MKKRIINAFAVICSIIACSLTLVSCSGDFGFGQNGEAYFKDQKKIPEEVIYELLDGKGWHEDSRREIKSNGSLSKKEYHEEHVGFSYMSFYLHDSKISKFSDFLSSGGKLPPHTVTENYYYDESTNRLFTDSNFWLKIISVSSDEFKAISYGGANSKDQLFYNLSTFKRCTDRELQEELDYYNYKEE